MSDVAPAPRLGDRSLFPDLTLDAYLNHAGISPPSRPVQQAVTELLHAYAGRGGEGVLATLQLRARLRERVGRLIGVRSGDVALTGGTTHGIQAIALSFPWRRGDRSLRAKARAFRD